MAAEKRKIRCYKIADIHYKKALAAGQKKGATPLAKAIEIFVINYGKKK